MSRCPACFTNFRAFLCDMTCHPNNSDFLLITQDKPYTPPSPTSTAATNNDVELENIEQEDEHTVNSRRKRRSIVEEKVVVIPSSRDPVTPPTPTEEVVRLTYYLTNYYASNLFNSCK